MLNRTVKFSKNIFFFLLVLHGDSPFGKEFQNLVCDGAHHIPLET